MRKTIQQTNRKLVTATPFGSVAVIWAGPDDTATVVRVLLSRPGLAAEDQVRRLYPRSRASSCAKIDEVAAAVRGFLEGAAIDFPLDIADLSLCGAFQQAVLRAEHRIPRGAVSTYGLIAGHLGQRNAARAVGNALARNPFPIIVPCHRAVRSDGHLGGYQGGPEMKRALLEKEGIRFDDAQRVVHARVHYARATAKSRKGGRNVG